MAKKPTIATIDASLARWKTRLKRAVNTIDKLEKQRKRLAIKDVATKQLAKLEKVVVFEPEPTVPASTLVAAVKGHIARATVEPVDTDIPEFLRRGAAAQQAAEDVIADQLREELADHKRKKAQGRIAKMKAKKAGDLKKMPLSGKAALDLIRNG